MGMPYVALGDSYSAGVGAGGGVGWCFRGPLGYPPLLARAVGLDLAYVACNGALIDDLLTTQLPALDGGTDLVTVTIGGNDAGFVDVIREAASPWWLGNGVAAAERSMAYIRDVLPHRLLSTCTSVRDAAPRAQVLVTSYPRLFNGHDCQPLTFFTDLELQRLNEAADLLAEVTRTAAEEAGVEFVDVRERFDGHAVCDQAPFVNGLILSVLESYHPNSQGHAAYAAQLGERVDPTVRTGAADEPRIVGGPDAVRPGPTFWLPRLDSPPSLAAAAAAGLDPDEVRRHGAQLARWWSGPDGADGEVADRGIAPTEEELRAADELRRLSDRTPPG